MKHKASKQRPFQRILFILTLLGLAWLSAAPTPTALAAAPRKQALTAGQSQSITLGQTPAGLDRADWQSIQAQMASGPYLKASNTEASDKFGYSVAISGDTVVVGTFGEDSSATGVNGNQADNSAPEAGAVYVFTRSDNTWSQQAYLKASNTEAWDLFGSSLAISGDTLVVGAFGEDSSATGVNGNQTDNAAPDSGAVYVFTRSGATWSQQAYLKASNTGASDQFGHNVAISDDTLVVGAFSEGSSATGVNGNQADNAALEAGAAYVFTRSGATWSQQAYLKASNTGARDFFGASLAISGDTLVVGANNEDSSATGVDGNQSDNSASNAGAAYVFTRSGGAWSQQAYLKASNTESGDCFGTSLAISGDTLVVGAYGEDSSATGVNGAQADNLATGAGAVYVFTRSGAAWSQQAYLKASNTGSGDGFGTSVAISGDRVVVGAYGEDSSATGVNGAQADNSASSAGAAYVFTRSGSDWSQLAYLKASNTEAGDWFGIRADISDDMVVVGAYNECSSATGVNGNQTDNSAGAAGAAFLYRLVELIVSAPVNTDCPAGTTCTMNYSVQNVGSKPASVTLALSGGPGWGETIISPVNPVNIGVGDTQTVGVQISVPAETAVGTTATITLHASNGTKTYSETGGINVLAPPDTAPNSFVSGTPAAGTFGVSYQHTFSADGKPAPTYGVTAGSLPAGLTLDSISGLLSGTPTAAGQSTFTITATNSIGSHANEFKIDIVKGNTTIQVDCSLDKPLYGQPVYFTAEVLPAAPGSITPKGNVQFYVDGVPFGQPIKLSNGTAVSAKLAYLKTGDRPYYAEYLGDDNSFGSSSPIKTVPIPQNKTPFSVWFPMIFK